MNEFEPSQVSGLDLQQSAIQHDFFKLPNDPSNTYSIHLEQSLDTINNLTKFITLFKDDEIFTEDDGVYTWVIGTQLNDNLESSGPPTYCDLSK